MYIYIHIYVSVSIYIYLFYFYNMFVDAKLKCPDIFPFCADESFILKYKYTKGLPGSMASCFRFPVGAGGGASSVLRS